MLKQTIFFYDNMQNILINDKCGEQYIINAANQNLHKAHFFLSLRFFNQNLVEKCIDHLKKASDLNFSPTQYLLGIILFDSRKGDIEQANHYFEITES